MTFENKDAFLDGLFDHIFGEDDVTDEDQEWFDSLSGFFDQFENSQSNNSNNNTSNSKRRRPSNKQSSNSPRRRPRANSSSNTSKTYGSGLFFGS